MSVSDVLWTKPRLICSSTKRWRSVCWWLSVSDSWTPAAPQTRSSRLCSAWRPDTWRNSRRQIRSVTELDSVEAPALFLHTKNTFLIREVDRFGFSQDVQRMRRALPKQLENHLRQKCLHLLSYYQPECGRNLYQSLNAPFFFRHHVQHAVVFCLSETESEGLKTVKLSHLSALLDKEKTRAESLRGTCRENAVLLQRQSQVYLCVSSFPFSASKKKKKSSSGHLA